MIETKTKYKPVQSDVSVFNGLESDSASSAESLKTSKSKEAKNKKRKRLSQRTL